ncbi:carbon-nitrogen hydrolase family protein [Saccharomonospora sp. NB11]|uniref:carbon-nitrogen hydrolase family protein n=1 Tax=Saccharomonospora sp. NB11 TaxID=1642298 RepID=UPI0018D110FB|nr:carbon-nitrogen hydrolase family protein [Saccharomonospora sp. NB11]
MLRVGLCQVTSSADPEGNLRTIREWTATAAARGARVVVFPEAMSARFGVRLTSVAEPLDGPWAHGVRDVADEFGVLVVAGMFTPDGDRVRNTLLITGLGHHLGYDKIHLYDAFGFRESDTVAPGDQPVTVTVDDVTLGFATCYDVRFPELFQHLAEAGSSAVVVPASWAGGEGKREQWELLVRARALDSGTWVLGCDQPDPATVGLDVPPTAPNGVGHSTVADPFGRVHARLGAGPELLVVDVDPARAEASRAATAVLANRTWGAAARR